MISDVIWSIWNPTILSILNPLQLHLLYRLYSTFKKLFISYHDVILIYPRGIKLLHLLSLSLLLPQTFVHNMLSGQVLDRIIALVWQYLSVKRFLASRSSNRVLSLWVAKHKSVDRAMREVKVFVSFLLLLFLLLVLLRRFLLQLIIRELDLLNLSAVHTLLKLFIVEVKYFLESCAFSNWRRYASARPTVNQRISSILSYKLTYSHR